MTKGRHIVSAFDDDLITVQAKISEMGGLVEVLLSEALEALKNRDAELAQQVVIKDKQLDAMELGLEELATQIIALRQPMAQDLRVLLSAIKIASTLERIGDLAKNIARRAIYLSGAKSVKISHSIVHMGQVTLRQLSQILDAHAQRDAGLARATRRPTSTVKPRPRFGGPGRRITSSLPGGFRPRARRSSECPISISGASWEGTPPPIAGMSPIRLSSRRASR